MQQDYFLNQPISSQHREYIDNKANFTMFYTQLSYFHQITAPFSINVATKYATTYRKNTNILRLRINGRMKTFTNIGRISHPLMEMHSCLWTNGF